MESIWCYKWWEKEYDVFVKEAYDKRLFETRLCSRPKFESADYGNDGVIEDVEETYDDEYYDRLEYESYVPPWDETISDELEEGDFDTKNCSYCKKRFYKRCRDHGTETKCVCETFDTHNCTHKFKCSICQMQFKTKGVDYVEEGLNNHECYYECKLCLNWFPTKKELDSGTHGVRLYGKNLNCNDCFIFISSEGSRLIKTYKGSMMLWAQLNKKLKREEEEHET